jgi:TP901 family phage tail tape measure protein
VAEKIGEGYVEARLDTSRLGQDSRQVEQSMSRSFQDMGKRMQTSGKEMTRRMTVPIVALGTAILKVSGDFESSMNQVRAVTGATGQDFEGLRGLAQDLGRTTQFSATQAADAMYYLSSAGFDTNQVMETLPGVLQLAAAANMDLATAADIASNILSAFGMEASDLGRINDGLVATFQNTNTNVQQLGEAMSYAAPVAAALGVDFEDAAAAIGMMGNAGIQGSTAGTSLRMAMTALAQETGPAAEKMRELGINAMDAEGNLLPLDEIVRQLEGSGASAADMMDLFGQRAGPAMMALVSQGSDALGELSEELRNSGGIAEQVAGVQMEGLNGALARLKSAMEGAAIAIGDSGLLSNAANFAESLAGMFTRLAETNPELLNFAVMIAGAAAAVGPATWAIGGMVTGFGKVIGAINPVTIALGLGLTAVGLYAKAKADARQRVEELKGSLDQETGALTDNTRALYENRLEQDGLMDAAQTLGVSRHLLVDALMGEGDALELVQGRYSTLKNASMEHADDMILNTGVAEDQRAAYIRLMEGLGLLTEETQTAAAATADAAQTNRDAASDAVNLAILYGGDYASALGDARTGNTDLAGAVADLSGEFDGQTSAADEATSAVEGYLEAVAIATDPVFALKAATDKVAEANRAYTETMNDSKASAKDKADAAWAVFEADVALEGAALRAGESTGEFENRLDQFARNGGKNAEKQAELIAGSFVDVEAKGTKAAKPYNMSVHLDNFRQVTSELDGVERRAIAASQNRSFRITATYDIPPPPKTVPGLVEKRAAGGPIRAGHPYLVGEEGPELVVPDLSGTVIPADLTAKVMAGVSAPAASQMSTSTTYAPTYVISGDPSPDTLAKVRHRERVAYMEMR